MLDRFFHSIEGLVPVKWRWVLGHGGFRRYFANTGWMFFGQAFNLLLSFFIGAWVIRYLGPTNYGVFSYSLAFVGLFSFIASLGVDSILQRDLINYPEKRDKLMGTAFGLKLIGGIFALLITILSIFLIDGSFLVRFLVIIYSFVLITQAIGVINIFFHSRVEAKKSVQSYFWAAIISSFLKVVLIVSGMGVIWIMFVFLLDYVWSSIFLIYAYKKSGFKIKNWKFDISLAKVMFSNSWLLALTSASALIYMKIDQVMIKQMMNQNSVGLYASAVRIFELTYIVPSIICASLFPAILNAKKIDIKLYKNRLKKIGWLLLVLSLIIAILVSFLSKYIIIILFGNEYIGAINVLKIGVWSLIGISIGYLVGQYLVAENYIKIHFFSTLAGAIINIVLNIIMIPVFGIIGSAIATVISYLSVPFFAFLFIKINKK